MVCIVWEWFVWQFFYNISLLHFRGQSINYQLAFTGEKEYTTIYNFFMKQVIIHFGIFILPYVSYVCFMCKICVMGIPL